MKTVQLYRQTFKTLELCRQQSFKHFQEITSLKLISAEAFFKWALAEPKKKPKTPLGQYSDTGVLVASFLMHRVPQIIQDSPVKQQKLTEIEIEHKLSTDIRQ